MACRFLLAIINVFVFCCFIYLKNVLNIGNTVTIL